MVVVVCLLPADLVRVRERACFVPKSIQYCCLFAKNKVTTKDFRTFKVHKTCRLYVFPLQHICSTHFVLVDRLFATHYHTIHKSLWLKDNQTPLAPLVNIILWFPWAAVYRLLCTGAMPPNSSICLNISFVWSLFFRPDKKGR